MVVGGSFSVEGVFKPSQFNGLSNSPNGCLDATGLYLVSSSAMTFANLLSKNLYEYELCCIIHPLKVLIDILMWLLIAKHSLVQWLRSEAGKDSSICSVVWQSVY